MFENFMPCHAVIMTTSLDYLDRHTLFFFLLFYLLVGVLACASPVGKHCPTSVPDLPTKYFTERLIT